MSGRALAGAGAVAGRRVQARAAIRIKDIVSVQGVRANQLVGYGLVIGLNGTGDSLRNAPFTEQSLQSMLDRMGINVRNSKAPHAQCGGRDRHRRTAARSSARARAST